MAARCRVGLKEKPTFFFDQRNVIVDRQIYLGMDRGCSSDELLSRLDALDRSTQELATAIAQKNALIAEQQPFIPVQTRAALRCDSQHAGHSRESSSVSSGLRSETRTGLRSGFNSNPCLKSCGPRLCFGSGSASSPTSSRGDSTPECKNEDKPIKCLAFANLSWSTIKRPFLGALPSDLACGGFDTPRWDIPRLLGKSRSPLTD